MAEKIKCIDFDEAAGKTVKAIVQSACDDNLLIVFADGSLIQFYASAGYEDDDPAIEAQTFFEPGDFQWEVLQEAIGDLHPEIVAARKENQERRLAHNQMQNERFERAEFERLRFKFEGGER